MLPATAALVTEEAGAAANAQQPDFTSPETRVPDAAAGPNAPGYFSQFYVNGERGNRPRVAPQ